MIFDSHFYSIHFPTETDGFRDRPGRETLQKTQT